jgi:hypothetical protein
MTDGNVPAAIAAPASRSAGLPRRAAVTAGAIALFLVAQRIVLPFLDRESMLRTLTSGSLSILTGGALRPVSWGALGLWPFFAAFLLVETVAVVLPSARPLRHVPEGRARLGRAAWAVAVALSAIQGWGLAVALQHVSDPFGYPALDPAPAPMLGLAAAVTIGTVGLGVAAVLVSRHGLGNGFAVLFAVEAAELVLWSALRAQQSPQGTSTEEGRLLVFVASALPFVLAARPRAGEGPRVPAPTSGLAVVQAPAAILAFSWQLAAWIPGAAPLASWIDDAVASEATYAAVAVALTAAIAAALSRAFCPAADVVRAYDAAAPEPLDEAGVHRVRRALRSSHLRSFALVIGVAAFPAAAWHVGAPIGLSTEVIFAAFVVVAVARDLRAEARARAGGAALVSAWPLHQVYAVEPVCDALARAGIAAHGRGRRYRVLFHFFAPYAPIEILVPAERAGEAEAVCSRVAGGGGPPAEA